MNQIRTRLKHLHTESCVSYTTNYQYSQQKEKEAEEKKKEEENRRRREEEIKRAEALAVCIVCSSNIKLIDCFQKLIFDINQEEARRAADEASTAEEEPSPYMNISKLSTPNSKLPQPSARNVVNESLPSPTPPQPSGHSNVDLEDIPFVEDSSSDEGEADNSAFTSAFVFGQSNKKTEASKVHCSMIHRQQAYKILVFFAA